MFFDEIRSNRGSILRLKSTHLSLLQDLGEIVDRYSDSATMEKSWIGTLSLTSCFCQKSLLDSSLYMPLTYIPVMDRDIPFLNLSIMAIALVLGIGYIIAAPYFNTVYHNDIFRDT